MAKGVLLAGGAGTRLYPLTASSSKQLVAVYNKPMVYYPLTTLMLAGVRDIMLISTPAELPRFEALLGDGSELGVSIIYESQSHPRGIAEALIIAAEFIGDERSMLVLGDNIIYGRLDFLRDAVAHQDDFAVVFGYQVSNPQDYGVIEFDSNGIAIDIEEKPATPKSNWAVPGMYLYPPGAPARAASLSPSDRGELEITDLNRGYMSEGRLQVVPMGRGVAWFDTGTPKDLLEAANFIEAIERRQGLVVGSPEEVAFLMGYIDEDGLRKCIADMPRSAYRAYLEQLPEDLEDYRGRESLSVTRHD